MEKADQNSVLIDCIGCASVLGMALDALNLPSLKLLSREDGLGQVHFLAEATTSQPHHCASCGTVDFYRHGGKQQAFADTPIHGLAAVIHLNRSRWRCRGCGVTVLQALPDISDDHMMTRRLVTFLQKEGLRRTFIDVARETGLNERTVRRVVPNIFKYFTSD